MNWFVLLMREDNLNSLLGNVGVEFHFPLARQLVIVSKSSMSWDWVSATSLTLIKREESSAKSRMFDDMFSVRSLM